MTAANDTGPALVGAELAELAGRLRLAASGDRGTAAGVWPNRLRAAARCWERVGAETGHDGFAALAAALGELAASLVSGPPPAAALLARLHDLDAGLVALLTRHDHEPQEAAADPHWADLVDVCRGAARAVVGLGRAAPARSVALLVASPFLREVLRSRLVAAGRRVVAPETPAEAAALQRGASPPDLFVGDNEEPTNNLSRLRDLLGASAVLVLVGPPDPAPCRARTAGADAVWPEPWRPEDLPGRAARGAS